MQQIQLNQIEDDNDTRNRVTAIESTLTTLKWVTGVGLTGLGVVIAYLSMKGGI